MEDSSQLEEFFDKFIADDSVKKDESEEEEEEEEEETGELFISLLPEELILLAKTDRRPRRSDYNSHNATVENRQQSGSISELTSASPTLSLLNIIPQINNVVGSVKLGCPLDLHFIASNAWNVQYNPKTYKSLVMRLKKPRATAIMYSSGNIVCAGAKSEEECRVASRRFARILQKLGFPVCFRNFKIQNIVAAFQLFPLSLDKMAAHTHCSYEPEIFPALFYNVMPGINMTVFPSGKINMSGAKSEADIYTALQIAYPTFCCYKRH